MIESKMKYKSIYETKIALKQGVYEYKYIIDD